MLAAIWVEIGFSVSANAECVRELLGYSLKGNSSLSGALGRITEQRHFLSIYRRM